jgi:N-acetylneuraminic acid mutarotase
MNKLLLYICFLFLLFAKAKAQTWVQMTNFAGQERYDAVGFSIGSKAYIGLGINWLISTEYDDFWEWNQVNNTWTQIANFPGTSRDAASGFSIDKKGYIVAGYESNELWEWNGDTASPSYNTWTMRADFPGIIGNRTFAVAFSIGKKGYVGTGDYQKDFWEWDGDTASPTFNTWTQKADFGGGPRGWATGFSIGTKGYIGIGTDGSYLRSDFWEWDGDTSSATYNTWTRKADVPGGGRENAVGFSIGNNGYIGLGLDSTTSTWLQDFWQWNQASNTWVQKPNFSDKRQNAVGFSIGNKGYIGTGYNNTATNDFWEYCDTLCSVGINELNNTMSIYIFPNPTTGKMEIKSEKSEIKSIVIYDVYGEEVYNNSQLHQSTQLNINLDVQAEGVYFVQIKTAESILTKKIVLQR